MKHILFIARSFPPYDSSCGVEVLKRVVLSLSGCADVFCLYNYSDLEGKESYNYENTKVFLNKGIYGGKQTELDGWKRAEEIGLEGFNMVHIEATLHRLEEIINTNKYDRIISVCFPFEAHFLASIIARRHGLPWIAWYLDPFYSNYMSRLDGINKRYAVEELTLKSASRILVLPAMYNEYQSFGDVISIELPFISDFSKCNKIHKYEFNREEINCLFAGNIYKDIRDPDYCLNVFREIEIPNLKLYFVGSFVGFGEGIIDKWKTEFGDRVVFMERVENGIVNDMMEQADVLVNIGNIMDNQLPGKLLYCISTGKPIINFCRSSSCGSLYYMERYPLKINIFEGDNELLCAGELKEFILKNYQNRVAWDVIEQIYKNETSNAILERYCREFQLFP